MEAVQIGFLQFTVEHVMPTWSISNKPHQKETKANTVKCWKTHLPPASSILQQHELLQLPDKHERFFFFWATSIYLKRSILSVSVDLAKKSKFYEIQAAVLQSAYKAQCIAVARSSNSTQTTSPVHLRAPLAQLQQVFCQLASQKTSSSAQLLVRPQKRQRLLTRKVSKQELLARDRHLYNLKPTL